MNIDNIRDFMKDLFTLRTVWIDKGRGKWAVKKRLHPLMKTILCTLGVILCAIVYSGLNTPRVVEAEVKTPRIAAKLPEPEKLHVPEPEHLTVTEEPIAPPVKTHKDIIIPLTTKKTRSETKAAVTVQHDVSIWPEAESKNQLKTGKKNTTPPTDIQADNPVNSGKYNIRVNKSAYTLTLYKGSEPVKTYFIAVGKNPGDKQRVGDNRTPVGKFKIVSIENASKWTHDFHDGKGKIRGAYGPWFLRLEAKGWKGIGIHGTHDPESIGTMATEGCIRLHNEDIAELKQYAYRNMPVVIREN